MFEAIRTTPNIWQNYQIVIEADVIPRYQNEINELNVLELKCQKIEDIIAQENKK